MDASQLKHIDVIGDEPQTTEIDKFLLTIDQSSAWMEKYDTLDDLQKRDLHIEVSRKIEESVRNNDIDKFADLYEVISRLNEMEQNKALNTHTNFFILACKHDRLEILKNLLNYETKHLRNFANADRNHFICNRLFEVDETGHTACYYAIRSNNVDLLETLIDSVDQEPTILYDLFSNEYASLRLKNVDIHEIMQIFVEDRLVRERFLRDVADAHDATNSGPKKKPDPTRPENHIYEKLNCIITAAKELNKIASRAYVQNPRIAIALFIARNIRVLKSQLKSTYSQLPWEEMEFYLSRYAFFHPAERKELHSHLNKFVDKMKSVFGFYDESTSNESKIHEEIKKYVNSNVPVNREKIDDFKSLYDDYELMKDEYSLDKIMRYIKLALSVNPGEHSGRLIIQRALHVIGEFVKNSPASPNLSESAQETFYCNAMGVCIEVAPSLRDTLSHIEELHVLFLRESIESQEEFFTKLQQDLKRALGVIVHVSCCVKAKHFKRWCQNIIYEDDAQAFEEKCQGFIGYLLGNTLPNVEAPELDALNQAENLLTALQIIIDENEAELTDRHVIALISEIKRTVVLEKKAMANRIINFNTTFRAMEDKISEHLYRISYLNKRGNDTSEEMTVKEPSKTFFKYVFLNIDVPLYSGGLKRMSEISKLLGRLIDSVEGTSVRAKVLILINNISTLLMMKSYSLIFKTLEDFKDKLDLSEVDRSAPVQNIETELDKAFGAFETVLGSKEAFREVQSLLEKKKIIHQIKLKVNGCYEANKDRLTSHELSVVNEELRAKRSEGKRLLGKTVDFYGEFLAGKREFHKFAGAVRLKSKEDTAKSIAIFNEIKSQQDNYDPESVLNRTIQQFKVESTIERYDDMVGKLKTVKQDHDARLKLTSFFDCDSELGKKEFEELVGSLNMPSKAKTDFVKVYKFSNIAYIAESLTDAYGVFLNIVKNKKSTTDKICNAYVNFLDTLQLGADKTKLLKKTIIKNKIFTILDEQFFLRLHLLKEVLGNVQTRDSKCTFISQYRGDEKLQVVVEMLLFDLCNVSTEATTLWSKFMASTSGIPLNFLEKGFLYLNGNFPFLKGNSLRNYLAHGDALIDALPYDPSIAVISCAVLFAEESESLIALRDIVNNDNMTKNMIQRIQDFPDQLLPENFPSDAQFNFDSLETFQKSRYWKQYFKTLLKNPVMRFNICSRSEQFLNQCISQVTLFTTVCEGDRQKFESLLAFGEEVHSRTFNMESLLHVAASQGHSDIVEVLLNNGIKVDAEDRDKDTPLHVASRSGHCLVVKTLLERGAHVHAADMSGCTALHEAAFMGNAQVADILLKYDADCNAFSATKSTPLHSAAWRGSMKIIKLLIEDYKASVDVEDRLGNKPLHMAAKGLHNNIEVFDYLLNKDPTSISSTKNSDATPLQLAVIFGNDNGVETILNNGGIDASGSHRELLLTAVQYGNVKIVRFFQENGVDVNDVDWNGCSTALHIAAFNGHSQLAEYLIQEKYPVDTKTDTGFTPLHLAVQSGDLDTVKVLIKIGKSDPNTPSEDGSTPLHVAVFYNHLNIVKYLVEMNADPNASDFCGKSLLHRWASNESSDVKIADYLINDLQLISMLNVHDKVGRTPLGYAAHIATMSTIEYFVEKGARLDVRDNDGATLLHAAVDRGYLHLVKYFIEKMDDHIDGIIHAAAHGGNNVLHAAVKLGHTNIVNTLLQTRNDKAFVDSYNNQHFTPLFYAVQKDHTNIVEALLKNGACPNGWHNPEASPLMLAATFGFKNMTKILLKNGADPNRSTSDGTTPLLHAVIEDEQEIVRLLLDAGANVNSATNAGMTPIHAAAKLGHHNNAELLVMRGADIEALDKNGSSSLHYAIANDDMDMHFILVMTGFFPFPFSKFFNT